MHVGRWLVSLVRHPLSSASYTLPWTNSDAAVHLAYGRNLSFANSTLLISGLLDLGHHWCGRERRLRAS